MASIQVSADSSSLASSIVTDDHLADLDRHGVAVVRNAIPRELRDLVGQGMERHLRLPGMQFRSLGRDGARYMTEFDSWQRIAEYRAFLEQSAVAWMAAKVLGTKRLWLQEDHVFWKEPGTPFRTAWHQDVPFRGFPGRLLTIWTTLDRAAAGASLEFVRGSHTWGELAPSGSRTAPSLPDIEQDRERFDIVSWTVDPGDCLLFFGLTVHGAPPNEASFSRRFACRWSDVDIAWDESASVQGQLHRVLFPMED